MDYELGEPLDIAIRLSATTSRSIDNLIDRDYDYTYDWTLFSHPHLLWEQDLRR